MRGERGDDVSWRPARPRTPARASGGWRTYGLVGGFLLALAATTVVFLTDDPQYLRLAVLAAAWAFVLAAFLAGRRSADARTAAEREEEIRRSYEHELDREAAAHREEELELRREVEEKVAAELTSLRAEVSELALLRHEIARVARLGTDLPALSGLRAELASLAGLRDDVASLAGLRADVAALAASREDLATLAELRTDLGRLRTELSEQLNGEMLVERILLRTQSIRPPGDPADAPRTVESSTTWDDDRPLELTGSRSAVRRDEPPQTRSADRLPADRPVAAQRPASAAPPVDGAAPGAGTTHFPLPAGARTPARPARSTPPQPPSSTPQPPTPLEWLAGRSLVDTGDPAPAPGHSRHAAGPADPPAEVVAVPVPHERSGAPRAGRKPSVPPRRRRTDDPLDDATTERPAAPPTSYEPVVRPSPSPRPSPRPRPEAPVQPAETQAAGHERLEQILAETGTQLPVGGRRRHRYRDDDEPDEVLARVLGRNRG